ncbi:MAG TPA: glycosyltransferase [Gaiellaceae bacterium]|jgi:predicted glycosyltransferase
MKPRLLLHCQHLLGIGHLVRSLELARALSEAFDVTVLSGGRRPGGLAWPAGVDVIPLPEEGRRELVLASLARIRPQVVLVELFPFGRKKLAGELVPLLERARAGGAVTACSLRDILVRGRDDQAEHDERASRLANEHLDLVLVHADPRFARLEESFRPQTRLRVPVVYTGFVARKPGPAVRDPRRVVVSAGGGAFGGALLDAARHALPSVRRLGLELELIAGPLADGPLGRDVLRAVPDLPARLAAARASVSQCGYNTAVELLQARVPALVVPFAAPGEDEQTTRARRLASLGAVRMLDPAELDAPRLAREVEALLDFEPAAVELDFDGARTTTSTLGRLAA